MTRPPPIDFSKAPHSGERKVVRVGGVEVGTSIRQTIDASKLSLDQIRWLLQELSVEEARKQIKRGNVPSRVVVDNREGVPINQVKRRIEIEFGDTISRKLVKQIERGLIAEIRKSFRKLTGVAWNRTNRDAMAMIGGWEWVYVEKKGAVGIKVNPDRLGVLPIESRLILRPRVPTVGYENMLTLWRKEGRRRPATIEGKGDKGVYPRGSSSKGARGFMAETLNKFKRNRLFKNYTVYVAFTKRYAAPGETFQKQGSPIIVIRVRRKRRAYKRF